MIPFLRARPVSRGRRLRSMLLAMCAGGFVLGGCASGAGSTPDATAPTRSERVEVQEDVGFTVTEQVRVSGEIRDGYQEALTLLERGELDRGIAVLEPLAEQAPGLSAPLIDLGIAHREAGDVEAAEHYFGRALSLMPDHPMVLNELGILYRETGRFDEARASYERALTIFPGYHYARRNLAVLCDLYLGDLDCALENYEAYMGTVPEDPEASMWIADVRLRIKSEATP